MTEGEDHPIYNLGSEPQALLAARRARDHAQARARVAAEPHVRASLARDLPKVHLPFDLRAKGGAWGDVGGPGTLWLLRPEHLGLIPEGTCLVSILGNVRIVGVDPIDITDRRAGFLSVGLLDAQIAGGDS